MEYVLCRLCLTSNKCNELQYNLSQECEIITKIQNCLRLNLTINEALPNKLCNKCVLKIEEIIEFCTTVKTNNQILQKHFENGTLVDYYLYLTNDVHKDKLEPETTDILIKKEIVVGNETDEIACDIDSSKDSILKNEGDADEEFDRTISNLTDEDNEEPLATLKANDEIKCDQELLENTPIVVKDSNSIILDNYSCLTCNKICESRDELKAHYNQEHVGKNSKETGPTYTETVVNGETMYKCDTCSKVYSKKYLKRHLLYHKEEKPYICKLCHRSYTTVSDIMRHGFRVHSGIKLMCAYKCGFSSAYTGALKEHEDRVHKNKYKYICESCGKGFLVKTFYDQHQNVHTGLKPYVCDICGQAFHMEKYLTTHRSNIHPESLATKRLICVCCNLKCDTKQALEAHLQEHKSEHRASRERSSEQRKALCDMCGKILKTSGELASHRRSHLGEKPYKCSICKKQFANKHSMKVHEETHSRTTNLHKCDHCGKRYSQQSALNRHHRQFHPLLPLSRQLNNNSHIWERIGTSKTQTQEVSKTE